MIRGALGHAFAASSRSAPFERGRWRIGSLAYRLIDGELGVQSAGFMTMFERESGNAGGDQVDFEGDGTIAIERLDTLIGDASVRLIKLDIEGAKAKALRGATGLLERRDAPDLAFEFTPKFLSGMGDDPRDLIGLLEALGYRLQTIGNADRKPFDKRIYAAEQTYLYCTKRNAAQ